MSIHISIHSLDFTCGWEILMGQAEVKNYLKSTPDNPVTMRYAGEYVMPHRRRAPLALRQCQPCTVLALHSCWPWVVLALGSVGPW